jgi:hypothetical protein
MSHFTLCTCGHAPEDHLNETGPCQAIATFGGDSEPCICLAFELDEDASEPGEEDDAD